MSMWKHSPSRVPPQVALNICCARAFGRVREDTQTQNHIRCSGHAAWSRTSAIPPTRPRRLAYDKCDVVHKGLAVSHVHRHTLTQNMVVSASSGKTPAATAIARSNCTSSAIGSAAPRAGASRAPFPSGTGCFLAREVADATDVDGGVSASSSGSFAKAAHAALTGHGGSKMEGSAPCW
eukprot:scaffold227296_cov32-Tisochrysis_lutea.AAC.4